MSEPLFDLIRHNPNNKVFSIHNQESVQENLFFKNKQGDFLRLYNNLGVDLSFFHPSGMNSIDYYIQYISKDINSIFVHNTFTSKEDINNIVNELENPYFCLCPSANLYIENQLPDIQLLSKLNDGNNIVVGTDSLASNSSLNILKELSVIQNNYPDISLEVLLKWATINGAKAISFEKTGGSFEKNKVPGINKISGKKYLAKNLVISTIEVLL